MYKLNKGFIVQKIDHKQTIVFDGESSMLFTFNETASCVFRLLKTEKTKKEIVDYLCDHYKVGTERAQKDVKTIIGDFLKKKIFVALSPTKLKTKLRVEKKQTSSSKRVSAKPKKSK